MPSTISDFSLQVKKGSPNLGLANNYNSESNYNVSRSNPNRIAVTVNNTGRTVKTNYLVNVVWDTMTRYYVNNDISWNLNDLRVYDTDGITPLTFWIDGVMTSYTCVFVLLPTLAANSRIIYFEFGNPALPSQSSLTSTLGSLFEDDQLEIWIKSTQNSGYWQNEIAAGVGTNSVTYVLDNAISDSSKTRRQKAGKLRFAYQDNNGLPGPFRTLNAQNGLPAFLFGSAGTSTNGLNITAGGFNGAYASVFVVSRNVTQAAHFNHMLDGVINTTVYSVDTATMRQRLGKNGVAFFATGTATLPSNTFVQTGYIYDSTNFAFRYNGAGDGSGVSAQALNPSVAIGYNPLSNVPAEWHAGSIAEMLFFGRILSATEIAIVEVYLNTKFRLYATADMPTISIGSKTATGNANYTFTSYAPVSSWQTKATLKNKVFGSQTIDGTAIIQNQFSKTLASGIDAEGWTNSTQYREIDTLSDLIVQVARTKTITTTASVDLVDTRGLNLSSVNINDLSSFDTENEVVSTTYTSTTNDYIELDFACQDVTKINLINSYLRFENVGNTISYQANLTKNQNSLVDLVNNKIKIQKSDFTLSGAGSWSNMSFFKVNFQSTTGSQTVWYGNLRLNKNVDQSVDYLPGTPILLGNSVSSDDAVSYFNQTVNNAVIDSQMTDENDITFTIKDYLDYVRDLTFGDLPSFPVYSWEYGGSYTSLLPSTGQSAGNPLDLLFPTYGGVNITGRTWLSMLMRQLLAFIFPSTFCDVDLDLIADDIFDDEVSDYNKNGRYVIYATDRVGDILDRIINARLGYIAFDPITAKLIVRSGHKFWDNTNYTSAGNLLPTFTQIDPNLIIDYISNQTTNDFVINKLKFKLNGLSVGTIHKRILEVFINFAPNILIPGFGPGVTTTRVYFEPSQFLPNNNVSVKPFISLDISQPGTNFAVDTTSAFNNANIFCSDWGFEGERIFVDVANRTGSNRYLRTVAITGILNKITTYPEPRVDNSEFQYIVEDKESQKKYGVKELEIDPDFGSYVFNLNESIYRSRLSISDVEPSVIPFQGVSYLYTAFLREFKDPHEVVQAKIQYIPQLRIGQVVKIPNRQGRTITGNIIEISHNSDNEMTQTLTVREVGQAIPMVNPYFLAPKFDGANDFISLPLLGFVGNVNISVEAWVYVEFPLVASTIFSFSLEGIISRGFLFNSQSTGPLQFAHWADDANSSVGVVKPSTWSHVACTYEAATRTQRLYFNGLLVLTRIATNNVNYSNASYSLGKRVSNVDWFKGYMQDVRIWTTTRTASQILTNFKTRLVGNEAGLRAYYRLNETAGTVATDSTSNASNGTLTNFGAIPKRVAFLNFLS